MQAKYDAGVTVSENFHAGYFGACMTALSMGMIRALQYTYRSSRSSVGIALTRSRSDAERPERRTRAEHGYDRRSSS